MEILYYLHTVLFIPFCSYILYRMEKLDLVLSLLNGLNNDIKSITTNIAQIQETQYVHSAILKKLQEKAFPQTHAINIFPITSLKELEEAEETSKSIPEDILVFIFLFKKIL